MASLVELTVAALALHTPVPELLVFIEYLPAFIRQQLFQKLSSFRLREMEMAWEAAAKLYEEQKPREGFDPLAGDRFLFDRETQREWEARLERRYQDWLLVKDSKGRALNCRHMFWELKVESMFRRRRQRHREHVDELLKNQKLFVDVVRALQLSSKFICKDNAEILLALRYLQRLEIHDYPDFESFCWETMRRVVREHPHLTELKLVNGNLSDSEFAHLYTTLATPAPSVEEIRLDPCRITALEIDMLDIQLGGYLMLVALVGDMPQLLELKVRKCFRYGFDKKLFVNAALRLPALQRLCLESDWLEEDSFVGLAEVRKPLALRHLCLIHWNSSLKIVEAICRASMDGMLNLERLELSDQVEIRDPAIHALTSMLASRIGGSASVLTHLVLSSCRYGLEGVTSLLLALGHNKTLTHLNVGNNKFGVGFGDVLADFLLTNSSVTNLRVHCVDLTQAGVSARLLTALESNLTLTSLSFARNELCSGGASAILRALVKRAQVKPFTLIDLSGNGIDLDGLKMIADIFEGFTNANGVTHADRIRSADSTNGREEVNVASSSRKRIRVDSSDKDQHSSLLQYDMIVPIEELRLLYHNFGECQRECATLIKSIQSCVGHLLYEG